MPNSLFLSAIVQILGIACVFNNIFVPLQRNLKKEDMMTIKNVNPAQAYYGGIIAAYLDSKYISGPIREWQIDTIKEDISHYCEKLIDRSQLSYQDKEEQKRQMKQSLEVYIHGVKDQLKREGKLIWEVVAGERVKQEEESIRISEFIHYRSQIGEIVINSTLWF